MILSLVAGTILGAVVCGVIYAVLAYIDTPPGGNMFGDKADNVPLGMLMGIMCGYIPGAVIGLITALLGSGRAAGVAVGLAVGAACLVYLFHETGPEDTNLRIASLFFPLAGLLVGVLVSMLVRAVPAPFRLS